MSPERIKYHEWQEKLKAYLTAGSLIYDIGKSAIYDYSQTFKDFKYYTIDKSKEKNPDLQLDIEIIDELGWKDHCDVLLCNGVIEQCENPFKLIQGCWILLKPAGYALFGIILTGFPIYDNDRIRFTVMGIRNALKKFKIIDSEIIYRMGIDAPTYIYLIVKKECKNVS